MTQARSFMRTLLSLIITIVALGAAGNGRAQLPSGTQTPPPPTAPATDTAMIFQPSQPLIRSAADLQKQYPNSWGFDASFSDYGFGGGMFFGHAFSPDITGVLTADVGTAKGSREFDILTNNK